MIIITPETLDGVIAAFLCKQKYGSIVHHALKEGASLPSLPIEEGLILFNYSFSPELMYELNHRKGHYYFYETIEKMYLSFDIVEPLLVKRRGIPEIQALFRSLPLTVQTFETFYYENSFEKLMMLGANILLYENTFCNALLSNVTFDSIAGNPVPLLNSPILKDRLGSMVLEQYRNCDFCCIYNHVHGNRTFYTLYSRGNFDVLEIAKRYGGSGTDRRASFTI